MSFTSAHRDLSLVVGAKSVSLLGDEVAAIALTLRLQGNGAHPGAVAALLVAGLLPLVVLAPLVGRLVDGHDSRSLLLASSLAQAVRCTVLAFQDATAVILLLVAVLGCGQAVNGVTWQSLLPGIVGTEELPRAMGLSQAGSAVASVASPALAGLLFAGFGAPVPLLLDAATFAVITVAAVLVSTRRAPAAAPGRQFDGGGLRIMRADPLLRALLSMIAVFVVLGSMVNVVEVFLIRDTLRAGATWYGSAGAIFAAGLLVASVLAGRLRGDGALVRAVVLSAAVLAAGLVGFSVVPNIYWLLPAAVVVGAANGVLNVAVGALVMGRAEASARGRVSAALNGVASAAAIGAYALGAALSLVLGPREVFALAGGLGLLAPVAFGRRLVRLGHGPVAQRRPEPAVRADCGI